MKSFRTKKLFFTQRRASSYFTPYLPRSQPFINLYNDAYLRIVRSLDQRPDRIGEHLYSTHTAEKGLLKKTINKDHNEAFSNTKSKAELIEKILRVKSKNANTIENLPYVESQLLERTKESEFNRMVKKFGKKLNLAQSFRFNVIGFTNQVWKDSIEVGQNFHELQHNPKKAQLQGPRAKAYREPSEIVLYSLLYTVHYFAMVQRGLISLDQMILNLQGILQHNFASANDIFSKDYSNEIQDITNIYMYGSAEDLRSSFVEKNSFYIQQMSKLLYHFYSQYPHYNALHIQTWIKLIISTSLSDCSTLMTEIIKSKQDITTEILPRFIIKDLLYRDAHNSFELEVSIDLFKKSFDMLPRTEKYYLVFHLLSECQHFSSKLVVDLVEFFLSKHNKINFPYNISGMPSRTLTASLNNFNTESRNRAEVEYIDIYQLNWLLWRLSDSNPFLSKTKIYHHEIIKAQNLIVDFMVKQSKISRDSPFKNEGRLSDSKKPQLKTDVTASSISSTNLRSVQSNDSHKTYKKDNTASLVQSWLNLLGTVALANSLIPISDESARKVIHIVEYKFFIPFIEEIIKYDNSPALLNSFFSKNHIKREQIQNLMLKYYYIKIRNSKSATELLNNFSEAFKFPAQFADKPFPDWIGHCDLRKSQLVWRAFVEKAHLLNFLTSSRATNIVNKLINEKYLFGTINVHMVVLLIPYIEDTGLIVKLMDNINQKNLMDQVILRAFLKKLYQCVLQSNENKFSQSLKENENHNEMKTEALIKVHHDLKSYIRGLFNSIERPTSALVGTMLYFESFLLPDSIYNLYRGHFLENGHRRLLPGQDSIKALLNASLVSQDLVWKDQYAVQIAVYEFRRWVPKSALTEDTGQAVSSNQTQLIRPSVSLWFLYLKALYAYNYLDELVEVISWWENIRFIPSKGLLLTLLSYFPNQVASRFLSYAHDSLIPAEDVNYSKGKMFEGEQKNAYDKDMGFKASKSNKRSQYNKNSSGYRTVQDHYSVAMWPWPTKYELRAFKIVDIF